MAVVQVFLRVLRLPSPSPSVLYHHCLSPY
jgi:hypothetical protein